MNDGHDESSSGQQEQQQEEEEITMIVDTTTKNSTHYDQQQEEEDDDDVQTTQCIQPPSHILEDGRFIYLPPPNAFERSRFFERSIARHGLLEADMKKEDVNFMEKQEQEEEERDKTVPKVHPLAVASARIQANGLNELNRAINLATLVNSGEYFSYTNVVDPTLEADAAAAVAAAAAGAKSASASSSSASSSVTRPAGPTPEMTTQRTEALFCLKRKLVQFQRASQTLKRHEKRLRDGVQAQRVIDRRLFQLRQQWRLVAPEHGTRARLHPARTNEVVAIDVDVYDRDRVRNGNRGTLVGSTNKKAAGSFSAGRLASRVPRFATIELQDDVFFTKAKDDNEQTDVAQEDKERNGQPIKRTEDHSVDEIDIKEEATDEDLLAKWTRAEPFAVADPTLGRVMENFDPSKIPMLSLQLDVQKSSTGFLQSARLEPMSTVSDPLINNETKKASNPDEDLLVSLQHSLFCANLFESIRTELDPDPDNNHASPFSPIRPKTLQSMAWLASESEENFVAPPSFLIGGDAGRGLSALSVVHCHEGEVKVQLDSEYQLSMKLVEANAEESSSIPNSTVKNRNKENNDNMNEETIENDSGSQSPAQLHALCRALLLHAQDVYHRHSLYLRGREKKKREEEEAMMGDGPRGLARIKKEDVPERARILQSCVSLGSKMLFEKRIRRVLSRLSEWLKNTHGETMTVEWLSLSIFDLNSKFTICCRRLLLDGAISRNSLVMTRITEETNDYRKVRFQSEREFQIYLKLELQRQIKAMA
jgi:hypothetical protein